MKFNYHCILLSDLPGLFLYCCLYLCLCLLSAWNKGVFIRVGHCFLVLIHIKALVVNIDHNFFGFLITHTHIHLQEFNWCLFSNLCLLYSVEGERVLKVIEKGFKFSVMAYQERRYHLGFVKFVELE